MSKGYVYILSNKSMPGLVKIGRSVSSGRNRAKEIYQTGVPLPFNLEFEIHTDDCVELEGIVHERLADKRVNPGREFFEIPVIDAIEAVMDERASFEGLRVQFADMCVDDSTFHWLSHELEKYGVNIPAVQVASIFDFMTVDHFFEPLTDYFEWLEARKIKGNK